MRRPGSEDGADAEHLHPTLREVIPGYRIEAKLGGGGRRATVVYRALQLSLDRAVALKVLLPNGAAREKDLGRFLRESAAVARLPHPHIVTIHDAGRAGERRYIVMELLTGGSLEDRLEDGPLSQADALQLGTSVASALAFAHEHGIHHRAVRPANVLRSATGIWKLVDFGLAKDAVRGGGGETNFLDAAPATLACLAPEQIEKGSGDARSDVYGLGALLYHALTARPVFAGGSIAEIAGEILRGEPSWEPLAAAAAGPLAAIVRRALERDPERRHASGEALFQDLSSCTATLAAARAVLEKGPAPGGAARPGRPA